MNYARDGHRMAVLNGCIYAAGGWGYRDFSPGSHALRSVERYDSASDTWTSVADMVSPRHLFGFFVLNGRLTAVGGDEAGSVEQYDAELDVWRVVAAMQMPDLPGMMPARCDEYGMCVTE
jgi:kelch-like protein 2/3